MGWRAMLHEQIGEHREHVIALELTLDMDRQAFPAMLVDDCEHPERLPIMGAIRDEVIAPDMAAITRSQAQHDPSLSHSRPRLGCFCGTFSPSPRQIRSTRLAFTVQPSCRSKAVIRR